MKNPKFTKSEVKGVFLVLCNPDKISTQNRASQEIRILARGLCVLNKCQLTPSLLKMFGIRRQLWIHPINQSANQSLTQMLLFLSAKTFSKRTWPLLNCKSSSRSLWRRSWAVISTFPILISFPFARKRAF